MLLLQGVRKPYKLLDGPLGIVEMNSLFHVYVCSKVFVFKSSKSILTKFTWISDDLVNCTFPLITKAELLSGPIFFMHYTCQTYITLLHESSSL